MCTLTGAFSASQTKDQRDAEERTTDALTDLRHEARKQGVDFYYCLELSLKHFIAECDEKKGRE